jgi:hypothetical protein
METNTLKILAGDIVTSSTMSKSAKLQLLNWLQNEATEVQVKALLLDGKMVIDLDEQAEEIVNARFEQHQLNEGGWKTLFGVFMIGPAGWAIYRGIRALVSEKSRRCGVLGIGRERDVCLWKVRGEEAKKMAGLIQKNMVNCKSSKNPEKCKSKGFEQVKKHTEKYKKYMMKIKTYASKAPKKAGKAERGVTKAQDTAGKIV